MQTFSSKRETMRVQIRKQQREDFFLKKRQQTMISIENKHEQIEISQLQNHKSNNFEASSLNQLHNLASQIISNYFNKSFQSLVMVLKQFNFTIIEYSKQLENNQIDDQSQLIITLQQYELITTIIRIISMDCVPFAFNIDQIQYNCISQAIDLLINYSYFDHKYIIHLITSYDVLNSIFKSLLNRIPTKEKVYQNFDNWSSIIKDLAQLFLNILIDKSLTGAEITEIKAHILNSNLLKIWNQIIQKNLGAKGWEFIIPLQRILLNDPSPSTDEINLSTIHRIIQHCTLHLQHFEDALTLQVIITLQSTSYRFGPTTALLTKIIWEGLLIRNDHFASIYSFFGNITAANDNGYEIEEQILRLGVLDNFSQYINSHNVEFNSLRKMYLFLNNLLHYQNSQLCSKSIYEYLPFIIYQMSDSINQDLALEFVILIDNLISYQTLTQNLVEQLINLDIFRVLAECLLAFPQYLEKIIKIIIKFNTFSITIKQQVLRQIQHNQIENIFNLIFQKNEQPADHYELMEQYIQTVYQWQAETNFLEEETI